MTWTKCSDALPDREGDILVRYKGMLYPGNSYINRSGLFKDNYCAFIYYPEKRRWWSMLLSNEENEPDEWMYVP